MAAELTPEVRALLGARNMAHIGTLTRDGSPLAIMDRMSHRYVGAGFPVRSGVALLIEPEVVRYQELPFEHPGPG